MQLLMKTVMAVIPKVLDKRPIPGFIGRYEVTSNGYVLSLRDTRGRRRKIPRCLKSNQNRGYRMVTLYIVSVPYYKKVHRLVLEAFVGPCPEGMQACHRNGNRIDNRLENLYWGTIAENYQDRYNVGTENTGTNNGRSVLTEDQVLEIRESLKNGERQIIIAARYKVSQVMISRIKLRKAWSHI